MRLRYTGAAPVAFASVGEKEPGMEFTVADEEAEGYLRRDDVERVPDGDAVVPQPQDAAPRKGKTAKTVADEPTTDTTAN